MGRDRVAPRLLSPAWRNRATAEQKRLGWAMVVCIEKIPCSVLHETHERQVEGTMVALSEGSETSRRATWTVSRSDPWLF